MNPKKCKLLLVSFSVALDKINKSTNNNVFHKFSRQTCSGGIQILIEKPVIVGVSLMVPESTCHVDWGKSQTGLGKIKISFLSPFLLVFCLFLLHFDFGMGFC